MLDGLKLGNESQNNHIIIFAFWAYSHFMPAYELAKKLSIDSTKVTIVIEANARIQGLIDECKSVERLEIYLLPASGGRDDKEREHDLYLRNLVNNAPLLLKEINDRTPITAAVFEMFTAVALDSIKPYSFPHYGFFTVNKFAVSYMMASTHFHEHLELDPSKIALPLTIGRNQAREAINDLSMVYHLNCRFRNQMLHPHPPKPDGVEYFYFENECKSMCKLIDSAEAILVNSFDAFDQLPPIDYLDTLLKKFVLIGPLGLKPYQRPISLPDDAALAIKFLDSHPPSSVLYVAFGSEFKPKNEEITELGNALFQTDIPFIWSVHPLQTEFLPKNILSSSKGLILKWAPQMDILNHSACKCFLSHCGWNSCLEALQAGIPVICWPIFSEQFLNSLLFLEKGLGVMVQGCGLKSDQIVSFTQISGLLNQFFNDDQSKFEPYKLAALKFKNHLQRVS